MALIYLKVLYSIVFFGIIKHCKKLKIKVKINYDVCITINEVDVITFQTEQSALYM